MSEIKIINKDEIPSNCDIYYGGWSDAELKKYKEDYQTRFLGNTQDFKLEIITDYVEPYYIICRAGESSKNECQFFIAEPQFTAVINANGNIYRFDIAEKKFLDHSCYKEILFDNTQDKGNVSPYLNAEVSPCSGIMVVVDNEGISAINWSKVLWKKSYRWAYADYLQVVLITNTSVVIEIDPPDGDMKRISLNITTGEEEASTY
jgi:hypothetical protein